MAHRAELPDNPESPPRKARIVPLQHPQFNPPDVTEPPIAIGSDPEEPSAALRAAATAQAAVSRAADGLRSAKHRASAIYSRAAYRSREISSRMKLRARARIDERPLQALGVIAATAFAIGVALRIWRSSRYE